MQFIIGGIWLILYWYYVGRQGDIQKGNGKRAVTFGIAALLLSVFLCLNLAWTGWLLIILLFLLYDLFFDEEPFKYHWLGILCPGVLLCAVSFLTPQNQLVANGAVCFLFFVLLAAKRGYLTVKTGVLTGILYASFSVLAWTAEIFMLNLLLLLAMEILLFFVLEGTLSSWKQSFENETEHAMQDILGHQYEEIKTIYLNMRGWRHDYHNHIQVMKAQMAAGNLEELARYLDELEQDLNRVDTYVKSGNRMVDAILNSKISLAEQKEIKVNCKAGLPEQLSTDDVDLCVILSNLLDNAIEACEKIPVEARFLRIYMTAHQSQLYVSIQNSAKEELNFDEKNYISSKRGNHGLGMKRVKAMVEKYEGYLRLANEPGIFAAEVTMPL